MGVVKTGGKDEGKSHKIEVRISSVTSLRADMDCGRGTVMV